MSSAPKVLLLGDSVRMSYQPHVVKLLEGRAKIVGPADNRQSMLFTLSSLDRWIGQLAGRWSGSLRTGGGEGNRITSRERARFVTSTDA